MSQRLVIIGAGFAGMYATLSAARLRDAARASIEELEIVLVSPQPTLVVRPRLYEPNPETLTAPLDDVLKAIDVRYVQGTVETIDTRGRSVEIVSKADDRPGPCGCSSRRLQTPPPLRLSSFPGRSLSPRPFPT